jgi:hypothetical protein
MFTKAIKIVSAFTQPVIICKKYESGNIECGCASFILLNSDGWGLTASHVLNDFHLYNQQSKQHEENDKLIFSVHNDSSLNLKQKKKKISQIPRINNRIVELSYWWGSDNVQVENYTWNNLIDLAIVKINGLPSLPKDSYPIFKSSLNFDELPIGRSLCRTGFPFHEINATYDENKKTFTFAPGTLPIPRFPNDGILTRGVIMVDENTKAKSHFIETSTPGLRGQSGGPIFDTNGYVWGIQSQTKHLALGFSPKIKEHSKEITEHQFLNVGIGVFVGEISKFLQDNNIKFNISSDE